MAQAALTLNPTNARFRVLTLLVLLAALTYLDRLCISAAAPAIMQEFNLSPSQMGYVFSAFTLAYALFEIPSGWLGDYFGTRRALTRIVLWWSAFTMLMAATTGFASLLAVRFLFGMGEAGAIPNSAGTVSRWFPISQQGRAMGAVCIGHAIGAAATPPLVFWLIGFQGWRLPSVRDVHRLRLQPLLLHHVVADLPAPGARLLDRIRRLLFGTALALWRGGFCLRRLGDRRDCLAHGQSQTRPLRDGRLRIDDERVGDGRRATRRRQTCGGAAHRVGALLSIPDDPFGLGGLFGYWAEPRRRGDRRS